MKHTTVGVDIAKNVIQLHWVDLDTGEIVNKPVKRARSWNISQIVRPVGSGWKPVAVRNIGHRGSSKWVTR